MDRVLDYNGTTLKDKKTIIIFKKNDEIKGFIVVAPFIPFDIIIDNAVNGIIVGKKITLSDKETRIRELWGFYNSTKKLSNLKKTALIEKEQNNIIEFLQDKHKTDSSIIEFVNNNYESKYNELLHKNSGTIPIMDVVLVCSQSVHAFDLIATIALRANIGAIILEPAENYDAKTHNTGKLICQYLKYGFSSIETKLTNNFTNVTSNANFMITTPIALHAALKLLETTSIVSISGGGGDDANSEFDFSEHVITQAVDAFNRMQAVEDGCNLRVESVGQRSNTREPPSKLLEAANIPHSHMNTDFVSHVWKNITGYKRRGEMRGFVFTAVSSVTATASATPGATESTGPIVGALIVAPFEPHFVSSEAKRAELRRMTIPQLTTFLGDRRINIPEISEAGLKESLVNMAVEQIDDSAFTNMGDMFRVMRPRGAFDELIEFDEFNQSMNHPHKAVRLLDLVLIISPGHGDDVMRFVNQLVEMSRATGVVVEPPPGNKPVENALTVMHDFKKLPGGFVRSTSVAGLIGGWVPDSRVLLFKPSGFI